MFVPNNLSFCYHFMDSAIDGTHILIKAPTNDEHFFVNRICFCSINIMAVSSSKYINLVVRWPGSSHDTFVWKNSTQPDFFKIVI